MLHFFLKLACKEEDAGFVMAAFPEADAVDPVPVPVPVPVPEIGICSALVVLLLMLCTMRLRQSKLEPFALLLLVSKPAKDERNTRIRRGIN